MNNVRGKKLLSVSGVLLIVFGLITVAMIIMAMIRTTAEWGIVDVIGAAIWIISGVLGVFAGVLGVKYCRMPEKAQQCVMVGTVLIASIIALAIVLIFAFIGEPEGMLSEEAIGLAIYTFITLIVPVLYVIGAMQNKKSLNQG